MRTRRKLKPVARKARGSSVAGKTFAVHDNGGRPFRVVVAPSGKQVTVVPTDPEDPSDPPMRFRVLRVFVAPDKPRGNTILLQTAKNTYVYVGERVVEFQMTDPVVAYRSRLGNSDVPYPYVVGAQNTYFLFMKNMKYLPNLSITDEDAYRTFYDFESDPALKKLIKPMKHVRLLHKRPGWED